LQIRVQTLRQWRSGYHKNEKIPYLKVGRAVRYRKADLIAWTVSRVGETERAKEAAVKAREEQMRELRDKYRRRGAMQPEPVYAPGNLHPLLRGCDTDPRAVV
jgi:hypothetical protein